MAIKKVTKVINGVSREVLSFDDILVQIGAKKGDSIDFIGLGEAIGLDITVNGQKNPIILPDSFLTKNVVPTTTSATAFPTNLSFDFNGGSRSTTITATGIYRISDVPSWVSIDRSFAKDGRNFLVNASSNNLINSPNRSGVITFTGKDNVTIATVNVFQDGNPLVATISPSSTQTLGAAAGTTQIIVRLSTTFSISDITLSNTTGFSLSEPTTSTSSNVTTYTYTLTRTLSDTSRSTSITVEYGNDSFSGQLGPVTFNQEGFQPTVEATPATLSYASTGGTLYYDITSNTNWRATISSPSFAYQHSLQSDRNFTFDALTGTSDGDRIYVKITSHEGASARTGTATVTTTFGSNDVSDTVALSQSAAPTWTSSNITQTGFAVATNGTITAPTVGGGGANVTITYTTAQNSGTTYTSSFPEVTSNTTRWVNITATAPAGYQGAGVTTATRSFSTTQGPVPFVISIPNFTLPANGGNTDVSVTIPSIYRAGTTITPSFVYRDAAPETGYVSSVSYNSTNRTIRVTLSPNYVYQVGYGGTSRSITLTAAGSWNNGSKTSSDTGIGTQATGTAPTFVPSISSISGTQTFAYTADTTAESKVIEVNYDTTTTNYRTPSTVIFEMNTSLFNFYEGALSSDMTLSTSGTSKSATAVGTSSPPKKIQIYPTSTNTTPDRRETTVTVRASNGAGSDTETIVVRQNGNIVWSLSTIPSLSYERWQKEVLNEFSKNLPYVFDYMNTGFNQGRFAVYTTNAGNSKSGAAISSTSNRLTSGNKSFTVSRNADLLSGDTFLGFDVGAWVSISETTFSIRGTISRYMVGTVTAWNSTTKVLSVNIPSSNSNFTTTIKTDNTTTSYTSWEIYQISGTANHSATLVSRTENDLGNVISSTLYINDLNNAYSRDTLEEDIFQQLPEFSGKLFNPYDVNSAPPAFTLGVGGNYNFGQVWSYTDSAAKVYSFAIRTSYPLEIKVDRSFGADVVLRAPGSTSTIGVGDITFTTQRLSETNYQQHFELYIPAPSQGQSRTAGFTISAVSTNEANTEINFTWSRGTDPNAGTISPGTVRLRPR